MDSGRSRQYLKQTKRIRFVNVVWEFTDLELNYFQAWYRVSTRNGVDPIALELAFGGSGLESVEAWFTGDYSSVMSENSNWRLTATLEVRSISEDSFLYPVSFARAYKLEDLTDEEGNADLVAVGTTASASGKKDNGYDYDSTEYHTTDWTPTSAPWSVSAWLNPDSIGSGAATTIGAHDNNSHRCYFGFGNLDEAVFGCGNSFEYVNDTVYTTGSWYHFLMTWDGTTFLGFINNNLKVKLTPTFAGNSSVPFYIGGRENNSSTYDGKCDEVYIADVALPVGENLEVGDTGEDWASLLYKNGDGGFYDDLPLES